MPALALSRTAPRAADGERPIAWWLIACCALVFALVLVGGITRLTESGLSITQWQPLSGVVPPLNEAQWADAFQHYQAIPQYRAIHADMTLDAFKGIYLWEYVHRLLGRLVGAAFGLPLVYFLWRGRISRRLAPKLAALFVLGALQGAIGWYMVASGLEGRIEVSQYRLALHLATAVVIYGAMLWVALDLLPAREVRAPASLRHGANAVLGLAFLTLIAGAFVAGLRAGYVFNTFPLMNGDWVPPDYWRLAPWYANWFENVAAVQFDHRVLALATVAATLTLWAVGLRVALAPGQRLALHVLLAMAAVQASLGVATLLLVVPLKLAALHQAGAMGLVTAALVARHGLGARSRL